MPDRFGYGEIGLDIDNYDYEPPDGCKTHGRCAKPMTNADCIRTMSDEELAEAFAQNMVGLVCWVASDFGCDIGAEKQFLLEQNKADWLDWLQSPADGG